MTGTGCQGRLDAVDGRHVEEDGQRNGGHHLDDGAADGIGSHHLHGLLTHVVADAEETFLFHLLTAKHQHLFMTLEHLLGRGGDVAHRLLYVAADLAKTAADETNEDPDDRAYHQEDHRQLPGVPEHQTEQTDHGRPFPHQRDQGGAGSRGDLTRIIGHLGQQVAGVLAVEETHGHGHQVTEHLLLQPHHHMVADPGHAIVGEESGTATQGNDAKHEERHPLQHTVVIAIEALIDQRLDGVDEGGIHGGIAQHPYDAADQTQLAIPDITEQTLEDRPAVL